MQSCPDVPFTSAMASIRSANAKKQISFNFADEQLESAQSLCEAAAQKGKKTWPFEFPERALKQNIMKPPLLIHFDPAEPIAIPTN